MTLGSIATFYAWSYLLADMTLYLSIKALRRDFTYWVPVYGILGFVLSFTARFIGKLVSDFAATIHLRHPLEVGGLYFSINAVSPLVGMVLLLTLMEEGTLNVTTTKLLKDVTTILGCTLLLTATLFFLLIKREYR